MTDKLSNDELLETLNFCKKMYKSRLHALEPSSQHKQLQAEFDDKINEIVALIKKEVTEEFIEKWYNRSLFIPFDKSKQTLIEMLKEAGVEVKK